MYNIQTRRLKDETLVITLYKNKDRLSIKQGQKKKPTKTQRKRSKETQTDNRYTDKQSHTELEQGLEREE